MKPSVARAMELGPKYHFTCDCISCEIAKPQATIKQSLDALSSRLLALLDGIPEKDVTKLMPIPQTDLPMFEGAVVTFLRRNNHLHPSMETLKIQFLLTQIWYLLMR